MTMQHTPSPSSHAQVAQLSQGTQATPAIGLPRRQKEAFPELYSTAATYARQSQKLYFLFLRVELIAVLVAAFAQFVFRPFGQQIADFLHFRLDDIHLHVANLSLKFSSANVTNAVAGSFVSAFAVVLVIIFTVLRYFLRLDEKWHARRSLAEAVVGLVWRYSMQSLPGDLPGAVPRGKQGDGEYADAYELLLATAANMDMPPPAVGGSIITDPMRQLRNEDWSDKRTAYLRDRLDDQNTFYLNHAKRYHRTRNRLRWAMVGCYIAGCLLLPFNGLGAFTTAAGALGTWLGAKHYSDLTQSYSAMQRELEVVRTRAENLSPADPLGAAKWSQLVNEVETKLDGEHQDWLRRIGQ